MLLDILGWMLIGIIPVVFIAMIIHDLGIKGFLILAGWLLFVFGVIALPALGYSILTR